MAKKTEVIVDVSSIPVARKALYLDIIQGRNKERINWHLVITTDNIGLQLCKDTPDGKGKEDTAKKTLCSSHYATLSVAENFPDYTVGSKDYKDEMKEARTHFSSCVNRALVSLGYRLKKERSGSNPPQGGVVPGNAPEAASGPVKALSVAIDALISEAQAKADLVIAKLAEFQVIGKLTKPQLTAIGFLAAMAQDTAQAITTVQTAVTEHNVATSIGDALQRIAAINAKPEPTAMQTAMQNAEVE